VDLAEQLAPGNTGSYTSQITCNRPGLTADADGQGGTFQVPATPEAVTCTVTNSRTAASLVLQKTWVNGAAGDTADLTISGSDGATFGAATSTATGAPGPETDTANQATAAIFSGGTVDLDDHRATAGAGRVAETPAWSSGLRSGPGEGRSRTKATAGRRRRSQSATVRREPRQ
jgi:hypothetical protein